jgi:hypothetical protein
MGVEVPEERAEEAEDEGDQRQRQERVKVRSFEAEPAGEARPGKG